MTQSLRIGIIGDYDPQRPTHIATNQALDHAAKKLGVDVDPVWLPTQTLDLPRMKALDEYNALWCSPGSPYKSMNGALRAIRFARERGHPFLGT